MLKEEWGSWRSQKGQAEMPAGGNGKQQIATKEKTRWPVAHSNKYIGDKRGKKYHDSL